MTIPTVAAPRVTATDFSAEIEQLARDFVGRNWIFAAVDDWLTTRNEQFFLLTGEPGIGKSAIVARLAQKQAEVVAYHFCIAGRSGTIIPGTFARSIASQLSKHLPGYGLALANSIDPVHLSVTVNIDIRSMTGGEVAGVVIEHFHAADPLQEFQLLLTGPLTALPDPGKPVLILVDSLDEAATLDSQINIGQVLAGARDLPPWVRLLCTSRPERRVLKYFDEVKPYVLSASEPANAEDLREFIKFRLSRPELHKRLVDAEVRPEAFSQSVDELALGNFLYARVLLDDVEAGRQGPDDLGGLPLGLDALYQRFLRRFSTKEWIRIYQPLLTLLVAAQAGLTESQLAAFAGLPDTAVRNGIGVLIQFLDSTRDAYGKENFRIFHQSFREFLSDSERNRDFWCSQQDGHRRIVDYYVVRFSGRWAECDVYGLSYLPEHMARAGLRPALEGLLTDLEWLTSKLARLGVNATISDLEILTDQGELAALSQALRLSSYALSVDSRQLAPQLVGRLDASETGPLLRRLLGQAERTRTVGVLLPAGPSLPRAGGPMVRSIYVEKAPEASSAELLVTQDGKRAVIASGSSEVSVWNLMKGEREYTIGAHGFLTDIGISPDGSRLLRVAGISGTRVGIHSRSISVSRIEGNEALVFIPTLSDAVEWTPDWRHAVSSSGDDLVAWDLNAGQRMFVASGRRFWLKSPILDGPRFLFSEPGRSVIRDLETGLDCSVIEHLGCEKLFICANRRRGVSFSQVDRALKVWDLGTGQQVSETRSSFDLSSVSFLTFDGLRAIWASPERILCADLERDQELFELKGFGRWTPWAITPDGQTLVAWTGDSIQVLDLKVAASCRVSSANKGISVGSVDWTRRWDNKLVTRLAMTPDGQRAIIAAYDDLLSVVQVVHGQEIAAMRGTLGPTYALAICPDGNWGVSGSGDGRLKLWNLRDASERLSAKCSDAILAVWISSDATRALVGAGNAVFEWNIATGELSDRGIHPGFVGGFSLSGRYVVGGYRGSFEVLDLEAGNSVGRFNEPRLLGAEFSRAAITIDGQTAIIGGPVSFWDVRSGKRLFSLDTTQLLAATPDGRHIVSVESDNRTLTIWDCHAKLQVGSFTLDNIIDECAISADGTTVLAGDRLGQLHTLVYREQDLSLLQRG